MRSKFLLAISTLALGTALAAVPAIAQTDSGSQRTGSGESAANPSAAQSYHYPTGRAMNDGGFVVQQSGANSAQGAARNSSAPIERAQAQGARREAKWFRVHGAHPRTRPGARRG